MLDFSDLHPLIVGIKRQDRPFESLKEGCSWCHAKHTLIKIGWEWLEHWKYEPEQFGLAHEILCLRCGCETHFIEYFDEEEQERREAIYEAENEAEVQYLKDNEIWGKRYAEYSEKKDRHRWELLTQLTESADIQIVNWDASE